jgi:hypothetical protein
VSGAKRRRASRPDRLQPQDEEAETAAAAMLDMRRADVCTSSLAGFAGHREIAACDCQPGGEVGTIAAEAAAFCAPVCAGKSATSTSA